MRRPTLPPPTQEGSKGDPSAATAASRSGANTLTPPRSKRTHPRFAHSRSCLLVLSRERPMIWLISRYVIATLRLAADASVSAVSRSRVLASRAGKFRKVTSCTCSLV